MLLAKLFYSHNPDLVVLSFMLAVLASFVSLELAGRIKAASGRERFAWLAAAGIAMGGGVWSMHFVAMIALELPFAVAYDLQLTVLSLLMAVLVTAAGLYTVFWHREAPWRFVFGGTLMGGGVAAMHYIGMAALIMPAVAHYNFALVTLSLLIAIGASVAALWLAVRVEHLAFKLASAVLMGFAVFAMHFTGMAAFICGPEQGAVLAASNLGASGLSADKLAAGVAGASGTILLLGLGLAIADRRAKQRAFAALIARESRRRIDALLRNAADLIAIVDRSWTVTYLSGAAHRLIGELTVGADFLSLLAPEACGAATTLLAAVVNSPGKPVRDEFRGANAAKQEWFEITLNDQCADRAI